MYDVRSDVITLFGETVKRESAMT